MFEVHKVKADSDHIMANDVEDEEAIFVYHKSIDEWYPAEEFFYIVNINSFQATS